MWVLPNWFRRRSGLECQYGHPVGDNLNYSRSVLIRSYFWQNSTTYIVEYDSTGSGLLQKWSWWLEYLVSKWRQRLMENYSAALPSHISVSSVSIRLQASNLEFQILFISSIGSNILLAQYKQPNLFLCWGTFSFCRCLPVIFEAITVPSVDSNPHLFEIFPRTQFAHLAASRGHQ